MTTIERKLPGLDLSHTPLNRYHVFLVWATERPTGFILSAFLLYHPPQWITGMYPWLCIFFILEKFTRELNHFELRTFFCVCRLLGPGPNWNWLKNRRRTNLLTAAPLKVRVTGTTGLICPLFFLKRIYPFNFSVVCNPYFFLKYCGYSLVSVIFRRSSSHTNVTNWQFDTI